METAFTQPMRNSLHSWRVTGGLLVALLILAPHQTRAQVIDPFYANDYTISDLGSAPGVPENYGGITFMHDDPNTLLLGGNANNASAQLFSIDVIRGQGDHITGFGPSSSFFANVPGISGSDGIDGGLVYGPGNVLFYTSYSDNSLGQIKPGSSGPDRQIDLTPLGVGDSVGTVTFVPPGFPGAGQMKIASYSAGEWYDVSISPDGNGTYNIDSVGSPISVGSGPEGIIYVAAGNPGFASPSILLSDYGLDAILSFEIDANGDPIPSTQRTFITGLSGALGADIDPLTGDFLFSTYGGANHVLSVQGFTMVPEPSTYLLMALGFAGLVAFTRKR